MCADTLTDYHIILEEFGLLGLTSTQTLPADIYDLLTTRTNGTSSYYS